MRYLLIILTIGLMACQKPTVTPEVEAKGKPVRASAACLYLHYEVDAPEWLRLVAKSKIEHNYRHWYMTITEDPNVYYSFPANRRQKIRITNEVPGMMGIAVIGSMPSMDTLNDCIVWYYGCMNNLAGMDSVSQLAQVITHEGAHSIGAYHTLGRGIMYTRPFELVDTFWQNETKSIISSIVKKRKR